MPNKDKKIDLLQKRCQDLIKINEELQSISFSKDLDNINLNKSLHKLDSAIVAEIYQAIIEIDEGLQDQAIIRLGTIAEHLKSLADQHLASSYALTNRQNLTALARLL